MISLDWTFPVGIAIFLTTLFFLNQFFFKPLFQVLAERKAKTSDLQVRAQQMLDHYEALLQEHQQRVQEERQRGYKRAEAARNEATKERQRMISEARTEAESVIERARREIQEQLESSRQKLAQDTEEIARTIVSRVIGRS